MNQPPAVVMMPPNSVASKGLCKYGRTNRGADCADEDRIFDSGRALLVVTQADHESRYDIQHKTILPKVPLTKQPRMGRPLPKRWFTRARAPRSARP